jgi:small subunit ribosomal protein S7
MMEVKVFNRWDSVAEVRDPGLKTYINVSPVILPKTSGRMQRKMFWKSKMHIVERLINKIGVTGHKGKKHWRISGRNLGKSHHGYNVVKATFTIIEQKMKQNPIEVLVRAIENSAPREETTVIEYGGIRHPKAVDVSPQRRIDLSLRWITQGSYQASVRSKAKFHAALAEEIMAAAKGDNKSFAVSKKVETERQAASSR